MRLAALTEASVGPSGRTPHEFDPGVYDLIRILNDSGYITAWSCSGLLSDHPGGKSNMFAREGEWAIIRPPYIVFYTESMTPELRRILHGLGFRIKQARRGRLQVPGTTVAKLKTHPSDGEINAIFTTLGQWAKQNPRN